MCKSEAVKETAIHLFDPNSHKVPSNEGHDDCFKNLMYNSENKRLFAFDCRTLQKIKQIQLYLRLNWGVPNSVATIRSLKPCAAEQTGFIFRKKIRLLCSLHYIQNQTKCRNPFCFHPGISGRNFCLDYLKHSFSCPCTWSVHLVELEIVATETSWKEKKHWSPLNSSRHVFCYFLHTNNLLSQRSAKLITNSSLTISCTVLDLFA